jgi:hypothetical protein
LTHIPVYECSNFTPDKKEPIFQVVNKEGQVLVKTSLGFPNSYGICGLETYHGRHYEIVAKDFPRVISEHPIEPLSRGYFHFEPQEDHVFQLLATEALTRGEQLPYHYGWCSNRFLLINYGFCLPDYPADALVLTLCLGGQDKLILLHRHGTQTLFIEAVKISLEE